MDLFKFLILSIACIGGLMVVSYQNVAEEKGWAVGTSFDLQRGGIVAILGFLCMLGGVLISFFVNPWWSAPLVLIIGFIGNMILTLMFKKASQILALLLVLFSYVAIPIYVF